MAGEAPSCWGWGSLIWHVATFGQQHMAKGKNWVGLLGGGCRSSSPPWMYSKIGLEMLSKT